MGRKILILLMLFLFLLGLGITLYPEVNGQLTHHRIQKTADSFIQIVQKPPDATEPLVSNEAPTTPEPIPYPELLKAMEAYNRQIRQERQVGLCDPWSYTQPSFSLADFDIQDEVFGVISIPKLELRMPIYLGATDAHLEAGAAHLSQTSLPIGGVGTNAVIAGHRSWKGADYFRYITDLEPGDEVIITNLWCELRYTVAETKIIAPNDVNQILIQPGRDLITLLTCHPYASGGHQRFLVVCER